MTIAIQFEDGCTETLTDVERFGFDGVTLHVYRAGRTDVDQYVLSGQVEPAPEDVHFMTFAVTA